MPIKSSKRAVGKVKGIKAWALCHRMGDGFHVSVQAMSAHKPEPTQMPSVCRTHGCKFIPVLISPLPKPSRKATTKTAKRGAKKHG